MNWFTLRNKILAFTGISILLALSVIIGFSANSARDSAIESSRAGLISLSENYASNLKTTLDRGLDAARTLSQSFSIVHTQDVKLTRTQTDAIIKQVVKDNKAFLGMFTIWEPNAFDGKDKNFKNSPGHDNTGRYIPYWVRSGESIIVEPNVDIETSDYYKIPKTTKEEVVINPYMYPVDGVETLLTSLVTPIIINGTFYGITAVDIKMDFLQEYVDKLNLYDNAGIMTIISDNGTICASTGKSERIGKKIDEFSEDSDEIHNCILNNKQTVSQTEEEMHSFVPISFGKAKKPWLISISIPMEKILEEANAAMWGSIQIGVIVLLFSLLILWIVAERISKPILTIDAAATRVAAGDLTQRLQISRRDEIGNLADSFNVMVENLNKSAEEIEEKRMMSERDAKEATEAKEKAEIQQKYLSDSVDHILTKMNRFAEGDLSVTLEVKKDDAIGKLFAGFNKAVENINKMIVSVKEAVQATASASSEISTSTEYIASAAQEQSAQTEEVATAMEQMTKTIVENAENANSASKGAEEGGVLSREGVEKAQETITGMDKIVESTNQTGKVISSLASKSQQIGEIVLVINDIADQTNLLALNAAIEAARAGEQGRGFAVVADEVRKLAERTTKATKEVEETIKGIQKETEAADKTMIDSKSAVTNGLKLTNEIAVQLGKISQIADAANNGIAQIAAATEEQSSSAEQIAINVETINNVTNESTAGIQQVAASAEDLKRLALNLTDLVSQFKINNSLGYETDSSKNISDFYLSENGLKKKETVGLLAD